MPSRFSLQGSIEPTVDERAAERAGDDLAATLQDSIGDLEPGMADAGGGVGGLGGARGGGGAGIGGAAAAGGALGRGAMGGGAAAGALTKVALAGAVGYGLLQGIQTLAGASPALKQTNQMFGTAMELFFRPFGSFLSETLRPFAKAGVDMATNFNDAYANGNLGVALLELGGDVVSTWATGFANALADTLTGQASKGDLALLLGGGLTAAKLAGILPSIGIGSILTGASAGTLSSLLPSVGIGSILTGASTGTMASLLPSVALGTVVAPAASIAALIGATISLSDLVDGDISGWNLPAKFGQSLGEAFAQDYPELGNTIENAFTKNLAYDFGQWVREAMQGEAEPREAPEDPDEPFEDVYGEPNTGDTGGNGSYGPRPSFYEDAREYRERMREQERQRQRERYAGYSPTPGGQSNWQGYDPTPGSSGDGTADEMRQTREEMTRELRRTREAIENIDVPVLDATDERFDPF